MPAIREAISYGRGDFFFFTFIGIYGRRLCTARVANKPKLRRAVMGNKSSKKTLDDGSSDYKEIGDGSLGKDCYSAANGRLFSKDVSVAATRSGRTSAVAYFQEQEAKKAHGPHL